MGNIKESIIPYAKKHFKLAQLSFDKYGALSPTDNKPKDDTKESNGSLDTENAIENKSFENVGNVPDKNSASPRKFSQVECESSAPKVSLEENSFWYDYHLMKYIYILFYFAFLNYLFS